MYVRIPVLRHHNGLKLTNLNDDTCGDIWEIGVPEKRSLLWSVTLALLKPNERSDDEFKALVQCLSGQKAISEQNIKKSIVKYNPFLDRYSCFHNQYLIFLVHKFEKIVNKYVKNNYPETEFRSFIKHKKSANYDEMQFEAICFTLKCKIWVIYETFSESYITKLNEPIISFHPKDLTSETKSLNREILLYCKTKERNELIETVNRVFTFGLSEVGGSDLQRISLEKILRPISFSLEIKEFNFQKLYDLPGIRDNFLITMLKSEKSKHNEFIYNLYKQPPSILWQLSQAGFITNPVLGDLTEKGSLNAFFYAILFGQVKSLYLLYKYATSTPQLPYGSSRKSNPKILYNFEEVSSSLADAKNAFKNLTESFDTNLSLVCIEELIQVHDFQLTIRRKIFDINQRVDYVDEFFEVKKRRDVLISIISLYAERFYSINMVKNRDCPSIEGYEHYIEYINYFQNLDSLSALFFFDHVFLLKDKLKLEDDLYENMESAFISLVFTNKYSISNIKTSLEDSMQHQVPSSEESGILLRSPNLADLNLTYSYLSRAVFENKLTKFRDHLCNVSVTDENTSNIRRDLAGYNLKSEPIIKDDLILVRLLYYLDMTIELNFENDSGIALFAIQRTLQILGECVKPDVLDSPTVAKSFLVSAFTKTIAKDLGRIRDYLLHHEMKQTQSRLDMEKNGAFFLDIKQELASLKHNVNHLFQLQDLRTENYVYQSILKVVELWKESLVEENVEAYSPITGQMLNFIGRSFGDRKQKLETYRSIIKKQLHIIQEKLRETLNSNNVYENHLSNLFIWIANNCTKNGKEALEYRFICIQSLLGFLLEEISVENPGLKCKFQSVIRNTQCKFQNLSQKLTAKKFSQSIKEISEEYKVLKGEIYKAVELQTFDVCTEEVNCVDFDNNSAIHKFHLVLKGFHFISNTEKESVLLNVPHDYINNHNILKEIFQHIEDSDCETSYLSSKAEDLKFSRQKMREIEDITMNRRLTELEKFIDKNDLFGHLVKCLNKSCLCIKENKVFCETFKFKEDIQKIMEKITLGKGKPREDKALDFFCDRVKNLKKLLIEDNEQINALWKRGKISRSKRIIIHDQIVQLYTQQPKLQAAVEFLLCDCMALLKKKDANLDYLWYKTNSLFNGMNLRNMLAHGNPLFDAVSKFFDPSDLPNEIVEKTLDLIGNADVIVAIHALQAKTKYSFGEFIKLVASDDREHGKQIRKISICKTWMEYARLIPLDHTSNFTEEKKET